MRASSTELAWSWAHSFDSSEIRAEVTRPRKLFSQVALGPACSKVLADVFETSWLPKPCKEKMSSPAHAGTAQSERKHEMTIASDVLRIAVISASSARLVEPGSAALGAARTRAGRAGKDPG